MRKKIEFIEFIDSTEKHIKPYKVPICYVPKEDDKMPTFFIENREPFAFRILNEHTNDNYEEGAGKPTSLDVG